MSRTNMLVIPIAFLALAATAGEKAVIDAEKIVKAPVRSLDIFKNGLVLVTREASIPKEGFCYVDGSVKPVHGTVWSRAGLEALKYRVAEKKESPMDRRSPAERHGGHDATVFFATSLPGMEETIAELKKGAARSMTIFPEPEGAATPNTYKVRGFVCPVEKEKEEAGENQNNVEAVGNWKGQVPESPVSEKVYDGVAVKLDNGSFLRIPTSCIRSIIADGENQVEETREKTLWKISGQEGEASIEYLTRGMAWAPSYRLELKGDDKGVLVMGTDIRNELEDFEDVAIRLVSGYPRIDQEKRLSLLDLELPLENFFSEVSRPMMRYAPKTAMFANSGGGYREMAMDGAVMEESASLSSALSDMDYKEAGRASIRKGDTLRLELARESVSCRRESSLCLAPMRNVYGRGDEVMMTNETRTVNENLVFKNPCSFPLTGAPLEIMDKGGVYCQTMINWLNPGQETSVTMTRALGLGARQSESEDLEYRNARHTFKGNHGYEYVGTLVNGCISLQNFSQSDRRVVIELAVYGQIQTTEWPEAELAGSNTYSGSDSPNVRDSRTLVVTVPKGGSREIRYSYKSWSRE